MDYVHSWQLANVQSCYKHCLEVCDEEQSPTVITSTAVTSPGPFSPPPRLTAITMDMLSDDDWDTVTPMRRVLSHGFDMDDDGVSPSTTIEYWTPKSTPKNEDCTPSVTPTIDYETLEIYYDDICI
jgi:hypothetical protein